MIDTIDTENSCNRCAWWDNLGDGIGQCRRYAPRPRIASSDVIWPITEKYDYCGEYEDGDTMCACDDDETCHVCADIDTEFDAIVGTLLDPPRRRWWQRKAD